MQLFSELSVDTIVKMQFRCNEVLCFTPNDLATRRNVPVEISRITE
jgi:hypothetical protein